MIYGAVTEIYFALADKKLAARYTEGNDERRGVVADEKISCLAGEHPIWIHAVSVGEVQAAMPIVNAARSDGYSGAIVISTTTPTGKAMASRLGHDLFDMHIYYPWDRRKYVSRALASMRPVLFASAETELWPNMLWECQKRSIPALLVNGRISDRTWRRIKDGIGRAAAREVFSLFSAMSLRDEEDANRLKAVGVPPEKILVSGDSKTDELLARRSVAARDEWRKRFGSPERPVFIAGSTHTGEDEKVLAAFEIVRRKVGNARLIIVPRHPERSDSVAALVPEKYKTVRISAYSDGWDVLIADRIGVLFDLYGTARAAFVGGSFVDKGGQNILEPFSWGVPLQYGPHMEDFAKASRDFIAMGAAVQVSDENGLAEAWIAAANANAEKMRAKSKEYFAASSGASLRSWQLIKKYI